MAFDKQLSDEDKTVKEFSDSYFKYGVHKVSLGEIKVGETESGKGFAEATVLGESGEEDTARVWFTTEKSTNYAFNVLRGIYVHNAKTESAKEKAKAEMAACRTVSELIEKMQNVIGGELWFSKYPDAERTYTGSDGTVRPSVNKNIYGYQPKKQEYSTEAGGVQEAFPGATPAEGDAAANVPGSWK